MERMGDKGKSIPEHSKRAGHGGGARKRGDGTIMKKKAGGKGEGSP